MVAVTEFFVELFVADCVPYIELFEQALGARLTRREGTFVSLESPGLRVLLHQGHDDLPPQHFFHQPLANKLRRGVGVEIGLAVDDLPSAHRIASELAAFSVSEVVRMPWGLRDFRLSTPDGYYFRITEPRS